MEHIEIEEKALSQEDLKKNDQQQQQKQKQQEHYSLSKEQQAKFKTLQAKVTEANLQSEELDALFELDEITLLRYLVGAKFNVELAFGGLQKTIEWRSEQKPWLLKQKQFCQGANCTFQRLGNTAEGGHGMLLFKLVALHPEDYTDETWTNYVIFSLDEALKSTLNTSSFQLVWIIDMNGWSTKKHASRKALRLIKRFIFIAQNHYPERLAEMQIVDSPWIFKSTFKLLAPFIDPRTRQKIRFTAKNVNNQF